MSQGIMVFRSVPEAIAAGFQICECTVDGYVARIRTTAGWAYAVVKMREGAL